MNRHLTARLAVVVVLFVAGSAGGGDAQATCAGSQAAPSITMNFINVDISTLAKFISEVTCKNFIIGDCVRGKVTIITPNGATTPQEAYQLFQSALRVEGFKAIDDGKIVRIVPSRSGACDQQSREGTRFVQRCAFKLDHYPAGSLP
jgi:general secretion pathway protein D